MLLEVSFIEWTRFVLALILFLGVGKGALALCFWPKINNRPIFARIVLSFVLSSSLWNIFLLWSWLLNLRILTFPIVFGFSILGWVIWGIKIKRIKVRENCVIGTSKPYCHESLVWSSAFLALIVITYKIRYLVAGLGSDSYHHTLITTLFLWNRGLPDNYAPFVPNLITFNYHFGFHAVAAILSLLSGWEPRLLILEMMPVLIGLSGLSVAYFSYDITKSFLGAAFSALIPTLVAVFPIGMLEWGRYPQTLGLIFLPIFLSEYLKYKNEDCLQKLFISVIGASLFLTHYRVALMSIFAIVVWEAMTIWYSKNHIFSGVIDVIRQKSIFVILIIVLTLPWLYRVFQNQFVGYADPLVTPAPSFYSLSRLGEKVINYPTNFFLLAGVLLSVILVFLSKNNITIVWIFVWTVGMVIMSWVFRRFGYTFIDPVSIICSLYVPIGIILGWGFFREISLLPANKKYYIAIICLFLVSVWGTSNVVLFLRQPLDVYLYRTDLKAAEWIERNVPEDAVFMVNTYQFDFSANFIIGIDGGGWLPVIAKRQVITYPMTTNIERFSSPNALSRLVKLHQASSELNTCEGVLLLLDSGVTHVYIGEKGGPINPKTLLNSNYYTLLYHEGGVYVFAINQNRTLTCPMTLSSLQPGT